MIGYLLTLGLFYRRHLRVQPLRELMAIAGVAAGVALLFTVQVAHNSVTGSFQEVSRGVAGGATLEVGARSPEGFAQTVASEIQRMPGVRVAAPVFEQPIIAVGPAGRRALTLVGSTEQIKPLRGRLSLAFQHASESSTKGLLILTQATAHAISARPGSLVTVLVRARTKHLALDATVPSNTLGVAAESPIAASSLPIVQAIAGLPGHITRVLVEPSPGQEARVRHTLSARFGSTLNVRPIDTEARLLGNAAGPEAQITLLFSVISLVAGIIIAYNAMLLASDERRKFMVQLVEIGTPDSIVIGSLTFDAVVLGLAGSVVGLLLGDLTSLVAYHTVPGYIAAAFAIGGARIVSTQTVLIAIGGGLFAAFAAATMSGVVILRSSAELEAVGRALAFTHKLRISNAILFVAGAILAGGSIALSAARPSTTVVALVALTAGLVICLPLILRYLLSLASTAAKHSDDPAARLSLAELRTSPTRSVALLATGTIAAFLMVLIGGSVADVKAAAHTGATDLLSSADLWIKPGGAENVYTTQPFPYAQTQHRLQQLGVVSSVLPWRDSFLDLKGRRVWVLAPPPQLQAQIAPSQLTKGTLDTADRHLQEGGWVAISQSIANEQDAQLGQQLRMPTPTGFTHLRVAAIIANYGWLPGAVVMNGADHRRLWGTSTASELAIKLNPGVSLDAARRAVEAALPAGSSLSIDTDAERRAEVSAVLGSTLSRLNDTTIVVLVAAIVSVITLMLAAIWQRKGRLDSLMSIGMSTGQFARLVSYETGFVLLVGCLIGLAAGIAGQDLIDGWLHQTTGAAVHFAPAWQLAVRTLVIAAGISLLATMIAVAQTAGFQPRAAFSTE